MTAISGSRLETQQLTGSGVTFLQRVRAFGDRQAETAGLERVVCGLDKQFSYTEIGVIGRIARKEIEACGRLRQAAVREHQRGAVEQAEALEIAAGRG